MLQHSQKKKKSPWIGNGNIAIKWNTIQQFKRLKEIPTLQTDWMRKASCKYYVTVFTLKKKPYAFFIYKHTDGLQLIMVQLTTLSWYESKMHSIEAKMYFEFWILIFSQASNM